MSILFSVLVVILSNQRQTVVESFYSPTKHSAFNQNYARTIFKTKISQTKDDALSEKIDIELVSTKKRALDVRVFRELSETPAEYISKYIPKESITEEEAINLLMPGYDENGNYIHHVSPHIPEVYFAAIHTKKGLVDQQYDRCNGVVGVVRAQIRNPKNTNRCPDLSALKQYKENMEDLPPHVYLSNISVHHTQQRKGIGTKLLSAVTKYAKSQMGYDVDWIILDVESENFGAIEMYKRYGYQYLYQEQNYVVMFKHVS